MQTMSNNGMRMVPFVALEAACAAKDRTIGRLRRAVISLALALLLCVCALGACLRGAIDVRADAAAIMRLLDGLTIDEISEKMNMPADTVKRRIRKAQTKVFAKAGA